MDISDGMDKSWDHPWTTEEMRKKRREWSLAGDAGLLKNLQQFSENLVSRANKTQETLDSLTTQLSETAILIDNVTNTSLALANTQFIESRVQEDDVEIEKKVEAVTEESKDQDLVTADLIASVSESVRQGLSIMDEKYRQMEVIDSDSEEEDDGIVLSVILGPNNPYQDRPLPYVIGSEKWMNSSKIGLESSSSESEHVDEEEDDSESDKDHLATRRIFDLNAAPKTDVTRISSSLSESDNYSQRNDVKYLDNEKIDDGLRNNINSGSESITPTDKVPKASLPHDSTPKFAEELAKRLCTVRQTTKPITVDEKNEASINRFKDDLFTPEDDNVFSNKSDSIFSGNKGLFNDESVANLWKEKPVKSFKSNIIPASVDVPPPISTVSTKPKSAIDDLFADADSEDSDDIFSSKNTVKKISKDGNSNNRNNLASVESAHKKYLDIAAPAIATSTPETNVNSPNLFSDDDDDGDLFGSSKSELKPESRTPVKKKPAQGVRILGSVSTSEIESKLSSRMLRAQSTASSGSSTPANNESSRSNEPVRSNNDAVNDNMESLSSILAPGNNTENSVAFNGSSGILSDPPSIDNTEGSSIGVDFQPRMSSTRLKSEEIYRERIASDSLFAAHTLHPAVTPNSNLARNSVNEHVEDSFAQEDDVFVNEDLFGPPPLPKADSKPSKSKISSLFDESDSGDELFSTTSSGSRSQKSTDFLATTPQYPDKAKATQRKGLFDDEIDIFSSKDFPDVDIFGTVSKSIKEKGSSSRQISEVPADDLFAKRDSIASKDNEDQVQSTKPKKISLFDDDDVDDGDLFATKSQRNVPKPKSERIFSDDEDNDLFSSKKVIDKKTAPSDNKQIASEAKMDDVSENVSTRNAERKDSDILSGNGLFSNTIDSHKLVFEDDDYDDLFAIKTTSRKQEKETKKTTEPKEDKFPVKSPELPVESQLPPLNSNIAEESFVSEETSSKTKEDDTRQSKIDVENGSKKNPPKSLNIRTTVSPPPSEDGQQPRRAVSGKIKNLMGKIGDFKILSPMDTPPLWRRSEEKTDEEDNTVDRDSDDGGCISIQGHSSPPSISEDSATQKQSVQSTVSGESNVESAISFDEPAQVETLSTAASKTRVRIQAKRRPQSRHARKSALRHSGIDFDTVDASENNTQDESHTDSSITVNKDSNQTNFNPVHPPSSDRLSADGLHRLGDPSVSLVVDDKSELGSLSKESSMSANKNTLLSPSTDEEDLFDVPPDLPEDPQREDALFGRAPILSPVDRVLSEKVSRRFKPLRDTHIRRTDDVKTMEEAADGGQSAPSNEPEKHSDQKITEHSEREEEPTEDIKEGKEPDSPVEKSNDEMIDPLRDSSHDPLKDPSQLFAFVTKTPSPEKGKSLLFSEDDSLFSKDPKIPREKQSSRKQSLDLFADDAEADLFSASLSKPAKKPLKDTKISLFDDDAQDDEGDSLFGSASKSPPKSETRKAYPAQNSRVKTSLFDDDNNDLFGEPSEQTQKSDSVGVQERASKNEFFSTVVATVKTSHITDIFGDQSSGEDDIFTPKPIPKKAVTSKSLFPSDDDGDDGQIFGKPSSTVESKVARAESTRSTVKKPVLRELKKTAEKIGEDPLSILQDD